MAGRPASAQGCAVSGGVAGCGGAAAVRGFLARFPGGLAPGGVGTAEHPLGYAPARPRATVLVRLAALVFGKASPRAGTTSVVAAHAGAAGLAVAATLGDHLAAGQGLTGGRPRRRDLAQPRAAVGGVAASLARHAAAIEENTARYAFGHGPALPPATVGIAGASLAGDAAAGRGGLALAAGASPGAAVAGDGARGLLLGARAAPARPRAGTTQAATGAGAAADETIAGTARVGSAGEPSTAVLLAHVRATVFRAATRRALCRTDGVAAQAVAAGAGATAIGAATGRAISVTQGEGRRGGELHIAHTSRRDACRKQQKQSTFRSGHRSARARRTR